jgi:hypothetical protein
MTSALTIMRETIETGVPADRPDLVAGIEEIMQLMDYEGATRLEAQLLGSDAIERKYRAR